MKMKYFAACLVGVVLFSMVGILSESTIFSSLMEVYATALDTTTKTEVERYSYEIIPLLPPFNEYFFVKTDNPDPESFRFFDRSSVYSEDAAIEACENSFADVKYENEGSLRVNGGYLFKSFYTDGGEVCLQKKASGVYWSDKWEDMDTTFNLQALCDVTDYLISTYATKSDFFSNMDAVQSGFSSVCLYSGSNIRGKIVYDPDKFWRVGVSPHVDQTFYLYSPYDREDSERLFASAIYPFRYDSLGFPSIMAEVAQRLDSSSSYKWNDSYHWLIDVTYGDETRTYGGAGKGKGQGISEDKISRYFAFDEQEQPITLESSRQLLEEYAKVEMSDDIPGDNTYTWADVCETVGNGAWISVSNANHGYAYLYKKDEDNCFYFDEFDDTGDSLYLYGSLGYYSDAWVDGRYINNHEIFVPGATFDEYPDSDIILLNVLMPVFEYDVSYKYNYETGLHEKVYSNIKISKSNKNVRYWYDENEKIWKAADSINNYNDVVDMIEKGLIDQRYLDVLQLTYDEVMEIGVDRNTNIDPDCGYIYDGSTKPGTWFDRREVYAADFTDRFTETQMLAEEKGLTFRLEEGCYGMCGNSMYWVYLKESGTLLITGSGEMLCVGGIPWLEYSDTISQIFIGNGVTSIKSGAFDECRAMQRIEIPESVTEIGAGAFSYCTSLKEIQLPPELTVIPERLLEGTTLQKIEIPPSVTEIKKDAFAYCSFLMDIRIPAAVKKIGADAFTYCNQLKYIIFEGTAVPDAEDFVSGKLSDKYVYNLKVIYVPDEAYSSYLESWKRLPEGLLRKVSDLISYGDLNDNSVIEASDALTILKYVVKLETPSDQQKMAADVNDNGSIEAADALMVLRKVVKIIDYFPAEQK